MKTRFFKSPEDSRRFTKIHEDSRRFTKIHEDSGDGTSCSVSTERKLFLSIQEIPFYSDTVGIEDSILHRKVKKKDNK